MPSVVTQTKYIGRLLTSPTLAHNDCEPANSTHFFLGVLSYRRCTRVLSDEIKCSTLTYRAGARTLCSSRDVCHLTIHTHLQNGSTRKCIRCGYENAAAQVAGDSIWYCKDQAVRGDRCNFETGCQVLTRKASVRSWSGTQGRSGPALVTRWLAIVGSEMRQNLGRSAIAHCHSKL